MKQGTIKFFDTTKGYGFITADNNEGEVFVHASGLVDKTDSQLLTKGNRVQFEISQGKKGDQATIVSRLD